MSAHDPESAPSAPESAAAAARQPDRRQAPRFEAKILIKVKEESFQGTIDNCSSTGFLARITQAQISIDEFNALKGQEVMVCVFYMMHKLGDYPVKLIRAEENDRGRFVAFEFHWAKPALISKLVSLVENRQ